MIDLLEIGRVLKSHGVHGELIVRLNPPYEDHFPTVRALFLVHDGNNVPHMVEEFETLEDSHKVKLRHIDNRDAAIAVHGSPVLINREEVEDDVQSDRSEPDLSGFRIHHNLGQPLTIMAIEEYPQQLMLICEDSDQQEVLLPLIEGWIKSIDEVEEVIEMELPEGLLD